MYKRIQTLHWFLHGFKISNKPLNSVFEISAGKFNICITNLRNMLSVVHLVSRAFKALDVLFNILLSYGNNLVLFPLTLSCTSRQLYSINCVISIVEPGLNLFGVVFQLALLCWVR